MYETSTKETKWVCIQLACWYVSNVSIIYEALMLLSYLFWMFMGFIIHFYIIFGTNLYINRRPSPNCYFFCGAPECFRGIWVYIGGRSTLVDRRGAHKGGGRLPPGRALLPRGLLASFLTSTPSLLGQVCSKNNSPKGFIPFGLRLIFLFCETLK